MKTYVILLLTLTHFACSTDPENNQMDMPHDASSDLIDMDVAADIPKKTYNERCNAHSACQMDLVCYESKCASIVGCLDGAHPPGLEDLGCAIVSKTTHEYHQKECATDQDCGSSEPHCVSQVCHDKPSCGQDKACPIDMECLEEHICWPK